MWHHQLPCKWSVHFSSSHLGVPQGRRLGASSLKIKWPRIHPLSLHHRTSSKSNLGILGSKFLGCGFEITVTVVWLFPQKPQSPVIHWKYCNLFIHVPWIAKLVRDSSSPKQGQAGAHETSHGYYFEWWSNYLQGIVCISGTRRRPMLSWKKSVSRNWGRCLACI